MKKDLFIDGFHIEAIKKLLKNDNTPQWIKDAWIEKVKNSGYGEKIKDVI